MKRNKLKESLSELLIPLVALGMLVLFNLIFNPGFFEITVRNHVLAGNLISTIDSASELAIIAMGMTLVTAACGGQDISVGPVGAIAGAVFVKYLFAAPAINGWTVTAGILLCCLVAVVFKLFNGTLVAYFKIQPMIATLILFSCGRSIAYWIIGSDPPKMEYPIIHAIGKTIPGVPIPTPIFAVVLVGLLISLLFRLTNTRLYTQTVGINQGAARLNGINPILIKLLSFVILGVCVAIASVLQVCRMEKLYTKTILDSIEMDAILAVAIGGNNLGGGRFKLSGSILGSYIISMLTTTLLAMNVASENIKAYKAIVIIIIVAAGSPVIKSKVSALFGRMRSKRGTDTAKEA